MSIDAKEDDLHEFTILHGSHTVRINCFLHKVDDILLLTGVDVEGLGQGTLGKGIHLIINGICDEFCNLYQTERVII